MPGYLCRFSTTTGLPAAPYRVRADVGKEPWIWGQGLCPAGGLAAGAASSLFDAPGYFVDADVTGRVQGVGPGGRAAATL